MKTYPFPPLPGHNKSPAGISPTWTGKGFSIRQEFLLPILEYSSNLDGWNDDLTTLHEEAVGTEHPIDLASRRMVLENLRPFLGTQPNRLLEVGIGDGTLLLALRGEFPSCQVMGADVTRTHLHSLATSHPDLPLLLFDLVQCPLPSNELDVVVCLNVLEHIQDDGLALRQLYRILKPGGLAALEVPAGPWLYDAYDRELLHFRRYTLRSLRIKVEHAGFQVLKATHLGCLVFPAFAVVKLLNKLKYARGGGNDVLVVSDSAGKTAQSSLLRMALNIEYRIGKNLRWPFGIRCVLLAKKC